LKPKPEQYRLLYDAGLIGYWYLRNSQQAFYDLLRDKKKVVAKCHRRFGKGTTTFVYAFERAATEKIIIRYGAPTQKQAYEILKILIDHIYSESPESKPKLINGTYTWASGSEMYVFGCKDSQEADKARGTEADIIIADEYAFWRYRPAYVLKSVLSPQLDTTDGQLIITSTPPIDLTHPYTEEVAKAESEGYLFNWTINESIEIGDISEIQHKKIIERCGGLDSDTYKREYQCNMIPDKSVLVIPECQDEELWAVTSIERPERYNYYAGFDLGFVDYFGGVFGYVDFINSRLVIEAEYFEHYRSTSENAAGCRQIEASLGVDAVHRIGDCADRQQLYDMQYDHDYAIQPIVKRSKMANAPFRDSILNQLRLGVSQGRLVVFKESCPNLYMQLKYGHWNERRTDFERSEKMGHLDLIMALAYLFDNVDWHKNPYPHALHDPRIKRETHHINDYMIPQRQSLSKLVGR
jgi:hypothetical protein